MSDDSTPGSREPVTALTEEKIAELRRRYTLTAEVPTDANATALMLGVVEVIPELLDAADALAAEKAQAFAQGADGWRPIDSAPHATKVLLGWEEATGEWNCAVGQASWGWRNEAASTRSQHGRATHWMPLPPPPAGKPGDGSQVT